MAFKKLTDDQVKGLKINYYKGASVVDLASQYKLSTATIYNYLKGGPSRKHRKLTTAQVLSIIAEPQELSSRKLKEKYKVSHETIRRIRRGGK